MGIFISIFAGLMIIGICVGLILLIFSKSRKIGKGVFITCLLILLSISFLNSFVWKYESSEIASITPEKYNQLKKGMTPKEVKKIVGGSARSEEIKEDNYFIWEYEGEKGIENDASADLIFEDDRLSSKFESGLLTKHNETDSEQVYESEVAGEEDELESLKSDAEYEIESIVEDNYTTASIEINEDMGSSEPNKLIALVHLSFDAKNSAQTSYNMTEMFSEDLAAKIGSDNDSISQLSVFWKVPYKSDKSAAKFSYERSGDNMIIKSKSTILK
ncbi:hypothetical protein [Bacillus pumilus]|uniref:hypothetical protein n=1 Tax=Bacillus pumilus TaxID=1408 RepID=UPI00227FC11A|nr:hypothetical protein [Bacillus pumilus]MCY7500800.1 hypothetical protein [Bacillus pumilus]MCY7526414.1 hypothetical protein [Bacillus pumilus]MED4438936.1 hypothetical protein [Bacillus pumilus]MED4491329.1 hypothetical protein [Bacillus pumilus]